MTSKHDLSDSRTGRLALGLLPFAFLVLALAAAKTWLEAAVGGPTFVVVVAVITLLGMGYASSLSFRSHNGLDEVEKASAEFAARWSMPAGQTAFVLLLFLPPFRRFMTSLVIEFGGPGPGTTVDSSVVVFAMALGFVVVVVLQGIATVVFNAIWWKSKQ